MSGRALVDTNIVIALFAGDPAIVESLESKMAVFLCVPVIGELRYGALASARVEQNLARLDEFSKAVEVLPCDSETAVFYSAVKFDLRRKGRPIPENDVWIAAIGRQHRLTLVSRDSHFQQIEGLDIELL
ncbi:MAG TPA: type II toxin-antitoxin system VapC family toxin [Terriglobales bacterium]|nr:type II toxin-antitoxin system VapC family toxin [Terriglobales bacterium]